MRQNEKNLRFLISKALKNGIYLLVLVLTFFSSLAVVAQEGTGFVVDKIIVKVDNYVVLKSDLESAYQNYLTNGNPPSSDAKCSMLNSIILNKLMVAKAEIDSVVVTDIEVDQNTNQRMSMILQNSGNSPEQLEKAYGKTLDEIKLELRDQIKEQLVGRQMQEVITKDINVTPSAGNDNLAEYTPASEYPGSRRQYRGCTQFCPPWTFPGIRSGPHQ